MTRAAESTHWYSADGQPAYTVAAANGEQRPTTLRDARKLNLYPSVTTIIRCAAAPALERWKREQVLLAALTLPRRDGESEYDWLRRVEQDWQEQGRRAADRGTAIHAAIQGHYEGKPPDPDYWPHVKGAVAKIKEICGEQEWIAEASFAAANGYGGKVDLHSSEWVIDIKTKEFGVDNLPGVFDEHAMQLAAYRHGLKLHRARAGVAFVSASVPGLTHIVLLDSSAVEQGWSMFTGLLLYHQAKTGYRPK